MGKIFIGTSGWHYTHWLNIFYPTDVKGYKELTFHSQHFNTVENNSSFYRTSSVATYATWIKMTPKNYIFSMKLNKVITHIHKLELTKEVREKIEYILNSTQILKDKMGALVIQLPPSFKLDIKLLRTFLTYFTKGVSKKEYRFDIAIEFRNKSMFEEEVYALLKKFNVALVSAQSSRYPESRVITADFSYIRLHGPEKLFASSYSKDQLKEWGSYIAKLAETQKKVYVYFNNDFHGYALENAKALMKMLGVKAGV